jgi:hypothetical protein
MMLTKLKFLQPHIFVGLPMLLLFLTIGGFPDWTLPVWDIKWWLPMALFVFVVGHTSLAVLNGIVPSNNDRRIHLFTLVLIFLLGPVLISHTQDWEGAIFTLSIWLEPAGDYIFLLVIPLLYVLNHIVIDSLYGPKPIPIGVDIFIFVAALFVGLGAFGLNSFSSTTINSSLEFLFAHGYALILMASLWIIGRAGYRIANNENSFIHHHIPRVLFGLAAPIIGLLLHVEINLFGNFDILPIWIAAVVTGIAVWFPIAEDRRWQWVQLLVLVACIPYTLYFVVLFLPMLIFAIPLILYFGLGLLLLTPIFLFFMHANYLSRLVQQLVKRQNLLQTVVGCCLALLVLPLSIDLYFRQDASVLTRATEHVMQPDYNAHNTALPTASAVAKSVENAKKWQSSTTIFSSDNGTPLLSNWHNKRALGGYKLSRQLENQLKYVFMYQKPELPAPNPTRNLCCTVPKVAARSIFDAQRQLWVSDIDLQLKQNNQWHNEYFTNFELPDGAYVTDYYLDVFEERKWGMLTERYAAQAIYEKIVKTKRDPGLLFYESDNQLVLRVFPFSKGELRKTGFQITHAAPFVFEVAGKALQLGNHDTSIATQTIENHEFAFLPNSMVAALPDVERAPYFHVLLDYAEASPTEKKIRLAYFQQEIEALQQAYPDIPVKVTAVNYNPAPAWSLSEWRELQPGEHLFSGNAFWQRGVEQVLFDHYQSTSAMRPVLLLLTQGRNFPSFALPQNWRFAAPDMSTAFTKTMDGDWLPLRLFPDTHKPKQIDEALAPMMIKQWQDDRGRMHFISKNPAAGSLVLKNAFPETTALPQDPWHAGLQLHAWSRAAVLQPRHGDREWLAQLRENLNVRALSPITAFIVLETAAQEQELLTRQAEMLRQGKRNQSTNAYLGLSAYGLGWLFCGVLLVGIIWVWKYRG